MKPTHEVNSACQRQNTISKTSATPVKAIDTEISNPLRAKGVWTLSAEFGLTNMTKPPSYLANLSGHRTAYISMKRISTIQTIDFANDDCRANFRSGREASRR